MQQESTIEQLATSLFLNKHNTQQLFANVLTKKNV